MKQGKLTASSMGRDLRENASFYHLALAVEVRLASFLQRRHHSLGQSHKLAIGISWSSSVPALRRTKISRDLVRHSSLIKVKRNRLAPMTTNEEPVVLPKFVRRREAPDEPLHLLVSGRLNLPRDFHILWNPMFGLS